MRIVLVLVFLYSLSLADRDGGPYLGGSYGMIDFKSDGLYNSVKDKGARMMSVYAGAYISKHLSVELDYTKMLGDSVVANESESVDFSMYSISTLAHYAFFDDFLDFYAKFGAGEIEFNGGEGFGFHYGIGTSVRLSELISVKVAYDMYKFGYDKAEADGTYDGQADHDIRIYYPHIAVEFQF